MPFAKFIVPAMPFNDSPAKRNIRFAVLLPVLAVCTGDALALGLGELKVNSHLGASFQAEVQLFESPDETRLAGDCFRLSNPGDSDAGIPLLVRARIRVERQNGKSRLLITSDQTANEPVLQVNLRASCGSELVRSYTVLIDPASAPQAVEQTAIALPQGRRLPPAERPTAPEASEKSYPDAWQTVAGESAQSITKSLFPRQPRAQSRFLAALKANNPQLDLGLKGETALDPGTDLIIPDTRRVAHMPPPASSVEEKPGAKESAARVLPTPPRREKPAMPIAAGRMADRLLISGDTDETGAGAEAPLRLSSELSTRFSNKLSENSRTLLRLEYKLLSALYVQAVQQLAMAEQVRNLEASFEEMRAASENSARQTEAAMATAASSTPPVAAAEPAPGKPKTPPPAASKARSAPEESTNWWLEILLILGLVGALSWIFARRARKPVAEPEALVTAQPLDIPPPAASATDDDPWAAEAEQDAPPDKVAGIMPDIVLDEVPPAHPGSIDFEKPDHPVRHLEVDETGDYRTVTELADIMVCFGRIKGATQALEEFLVRDPGAALAPWMKLLEIFRANDMREEFEACALKLRGHFNVAPASWEFAGECLGKPIELVDENNMSIEELLQKLPTIGTLPHIKENILKSWATPEGLAYLTHLLRDTRDGKRSGFPLAIARELQFLLELLENRLLNKA